MGNHFFVKACYAGLLSFLLKHDKTLLYLVKFYYVRLGICEMCVPQTHWCPKSAFRTVISDFCFFPKGHFATNSV